MQIDFASKRVRVGVDLAKVGTKDLIDALAQAGFEESKVVKR